MKLGPVTKLDKRNRATSKKFYIDVISEDCDTIVIFWIFDQFGAVRRPDYRTKKPKTELKNL